MVTQVIHSKEHNPVFESIETQRKALLHDNSIIDVKDFGSRSSINTGNYRKVSEIAAQSLKPPRQAQLLFRLANHMKSQNILELGTSFGITTSYLANTTNCFRLITLEGCQNVASKALQTFRNTKLSNVEIYTGNFSQTLPKILNELSTVDFVFFDGNHRKEATIDYFEQCLLKKNNQSLFVFDDIYHSQEMKEAWEYVKANEQVTVTIDLFYMGLVFFKKELHKQDFMIRF